MSIILFIFWHFRDFEISSILIEIKRYTKYNSILFISVFHYMQTNIREHLISWFEEKIYWGVEKVGGLSNVHNLPFSDFLARSFMIFFSMHKYVWWTTANNFKTYQTMERRSFWCVMLTRMMRVMERRPLWRNASTMCLTF